jgi:hypothetical protein
MGHKNEWTQQDEYTLYTMTKPYKWVNKEVYQEVQSKLSTHRTLKAISVHLCRLRKARKGSISAITDELEQQDNWLVITVSPIYVYVFTVIVFMLVVLKLLGIL